MAHPPTAWIITQSDLANIDPNTFNAGVFSQFTAAANIGYELGHAPDDSLIGSTPYVIFTSYNDVPPSPDLPSGKTGLLSAASQLPGPYAGIILDLEAWPQTPAGEQQHPWYYQALCSKIAYDHDMPIIVTPGMDLIPGVHGNNGSQPEDANGYLNLNFAHDAALVGDGMVIQAERYNYAAYEPNPVPPLTQQITYAGFVDAAADQARAAHPSVNVYAGLSTCEAGNRASFPELQAAYNSVNIYGYWLKLPTNDVCTADNPGVAVALLNSIYS